MATFFATAVVEDDFAAGFPCIGLGGIGVAGDGFVCDPGLFGVDEPGFVVDGFDSGTAFTGPVAGLEARCAAAPPCVREWGVVRRFCPGTP